MVSPASGSLDLTLSLKPNVLHQKMSDFLKHLSTLENTVDKSSEIINYIERLRQELPDIEACHNEIPMNLMILYDAIKALEVIIRDIKQTELRSKETVMGELNNCFDSRGHVEGANSWACHGQHYKTENLREKLCPIATQPYMSSYVGNDFPRYRGSYNYPTMGRGSIMGRQSGGSLFPTESTNERSVPIVTGSRLNGIETFTNVMPTNEGCSYQYQNQPLLVHTGQMHWSRELRARFEEAVGQLGGPEAATPLHIRNIMQVDGLTYGHVQSYLQRYRLEHIRLSAGSSQVPESFEFGAEVPTSALHSNYSASADGWFRG